MTFRLNRAFNGILPLLGLFLLLGGCGEQDDQILGPGDDDHDIEAYAWLWAFDADQDSLRVYDAATGELHAAFFAQPHALLREVMAGASTQPTVWMGSDGTGFAFSAGFPSHGDHAHMEVPARFGTVPTGTGNTHLTTDPTGETVCWANDTDQNFTVVDAFNGTVTTVGHGSPHSSSLIADGILLATHMNENWARLIDVASDSIIATVTIDTLAHGEAYDTESRQAFIPCLNGVTVVGLEEQENLELIPYPGGGRVNFLFHRHSTDHALAPAKLGEGSASDVWILDMENHSMASVNLPGSSLAWNRGGGNLCLSADGAFAALTDLETARAYIVDLEAGSVETISIETSDMACALSFSGDKLWLLDKDTGDIHFRHLHEGSWEEEGGFAVHPGSNWIFITNLDPAIEIIRDY